MGNHEKNMSTTISLQMRTVCDTGSIATDTGSRGTDYHLATCLLLSVICREEANRHDYRLYSHEGGWKEQFKGLRHPDSSCRLLVTWS